MSLSNFRIVMFPWFAVGHMTPYLHLANKLAEKGCTISLLLPNKAVQQLGNFNLFPHLITFHTLTIPHVQGLPPGTETASDIPIHMSNLLSDAVDRTRDQVEKIIQGTHPNLVIHDSCHWVHNITKPLGIKTINYAVVCAAIVAMVLVPACHVVKGMTEAEFSVPPPGYPSSTVVLRGHEKHTLLFVAQPFGEGLIFYEKVSTAMKECDAIAIRTCRELEGNFCDYIANQYNKPVLVTGPLIPEPSKAPLENRWVEWLSGFKPRSVVFCAFGSQFILDKNQFQEMVLGFELTGLPFLVAVKPPSGASSVEEALPDGFQERVKGRGVVWGGWVQQVTILAHPSVGCFVNHCGFGSMWESLGSDCQIVLVPQLNDQILNTRLLADELKVGVEVEREENGWFSKKNLCKSIMSVMDEGSAVGAIVRKNHIKWRELLGSQGFMSDYIDKFVQNMVQLCN